MNEILLKTSWQNGFQQENRFWITFKILPSNIIHLSWYVHLSKDVNIHITLQLLWKQWKAFQAYKLYLSGGEREGDTDFQMRKCSA